MSSSSSCLDAGIGRCEAFNSLVHMREIVATVVVCVVSPLLLLALGLFLLRRTSAGIRSRFPRPAVVSASFGALFFVAVCLQQIFTPSSFPAWLVLWFSHLIPPIYAFPYIARTWLLFAEYLHQREISTRDSAAAGFFSSKLGPALAKKPWLRSCRFAGIVTAGMTAFHVVIAIVFTVLMSADDPNAAFFFSPTWLFLTLLFFYCCATAFGVRLLVEVHEDYGIRKELVTCFASWGVFAGTYFVLRLLPRATYLEINNAFPTAWLLALWPLSTFVVSIAIPAFKFAPAKMVAACSNASCRGVHHRAIKKDTPTMETPTSSELDSYSSTSSSRAGSVSEEDFRAFLANEGTRSAFKRFLVERLSSESLLFFEAVQIRHLTDNPERRRDLGREIVAAFFAPNAPLELNIDSSTRRQATSLTEDQLAEDSVFDSIEHVVITQMMLEHYPHYMTRKRLSLPNPGGPEPSPLRLSTTVSQV